MDLVILLLSHAGRCARVLMEKCPVVPPMSQDSYKHVSEYTQKEAEELGALSLS